MKISTKFHAYWASGLRDMDFFFLSEDDRI